MSKNPPPIEVLVPDQPKVAEAIRAAARVLADLSASVELPHWADEEVQFSIVRLLGLADTVAPANATDTRAA